MKRRGMVAFGIVLSIVLLFYALRDVSVEELFEHLGRANLWWLLAATVVATVTFVFRAIRWKYLLRPAVGDVPFSSRFETTCIGFMANNLIGGRVGEFARAYSLSQVEPVGISPVLASLVLSRLFDGIATVLLLIPAYFALGGERLAEAGPLQEILTGFVVFVIIGLIGVAMLVRFPSGCLRLAERVFRPLPDRFRDPVLGLVRSFIEGLGALRYGHVLVITFVWSIVLWVWNAFSFYLGFLAFDIVGPGMTGAMLLQSVISLFVAVPSTPGFFGPFEFGARVALDLYGIAPARIISYAAGYHILTFIPVTVLGIWYMRRLGLSRRELGRRSGGVTESPEAVGTSSGAVGTSSESVGEPAENAAESDEPIRESSE